MTDLNKEREADTLPEVAHLLEQCKHRDLTLIERAFVKGARYAWQEKAKAQAVPDTHVLIEKSKIETWWQDAEEPENFASRIEDMPSLGQYLNDNEIMEITEHHTIHLPSKTIYGVWVDKDGDRSFCTGTLEECRALVASESGAEG
ncbi:hypothetical protein MSC35_06775 [Acinetobacter baumannii]|nr:hypothetical protein [Acinetobacter baumannii]MDV4325479.1 hypothetical protein [Acinetobacter baumannii]